MKIATCAYCSISTNGQHEWACPINGQHEWACPINEPNESMGGTGAYASFGVWTLGEFSQGNR